MITYCRHDTGLYVFERNEAFLAKTDSLCSILLKNDSFLFEADISPDHDSADEARDVSAASSVWSS